MTQKLRPIRTIFKTQMNLAELTAFALVAHTVSYALLVVCMEMDRLFFNVYLFAI